MIRHVVNFMRLFSFEFYSIADDENEYKQFLFHPRKVYVCVVNVSCSDIYYIKFSRSQISSFELDENNFR